MFERMQVSDRSFNESPRKTYSSSFADKIHFSCDEKSSFTLFQIEILLDLSEVFDTWSHENFILKLKKTDLKTPQNISATFPKMRSTTQKR